MNTVSRLPERSESISNACSAFSGLPKDFIINRINDYIACGECFDKAGAYGIQGKGSLFVSGICGDYFNVVGLPVSRLARELKCL